MGSITRWCQLAAVSAGMFLGSVSCSSPTGPSETSMTLTSQAALDGYATSNGAARANAGGPVTGDLEGFIPGSGGYRQFYSFDLTQIPPSAKIRSATLRIYQRSAAGQPYVVLGRVIVDHVDFGDTLDAADYSGGTLTSNAGTLSTTPVAEYKTLDVAASVQGDLVARRPRTQFRVRFSDRDANDDGINDYALFTDAEDSCCSVNQPPQLVVFYSS